MYLSLALFGLLAVTASCSDESNFEAVVLNSNLFGDQKPAEDSPYWWMSKGSPFKRAVAAGPPQQRFDFGGNPFLGSGSNAKLYSAPGYLPPEPQRPQTVPCQGNGRACVPKYQCQGGYVDASQLSGPSSQECNVDSEVCCQVRVPTPPPRPSPAPTRNSYIPPPPPTQRAQPQPTPCYDRSSVCAPANQCYNGNVQRGSPYASRAPASQCLAPEVCCRVPQPTAAPSVTVVSYQPSPTTPRPYVTPAVQTQRPQVITKRPQVNNQYLPPRDNEVPQGNNPVGAYLPPEKGEEEQSLPIQPDSANYNPSVLRPTPPPPQPPRPPVGNDELSEPILPSACPAATNCTDINFCNADGTISPSRVSLTPDQETYRVPLSECKDESKGLKKGYCCRDPNYTDPWPTNLLRTGAFDANVLAQAFDDGAYRPNGGGRNQRAIKSTTAAKSS